MSNFIKRKNIVFIFIFNLFCGSITVSQVSQEWLRTYGPANTNGNGACLKVDNAGNSYIGGTISTGSSPADGCMMKYNASGTQEWVHNYNGPANSYDAINAIAIDAAGNVYGAGVSSGYVTGNDFLVLKYNSSGNILWSMTYNDTANSIDIANSIAVDASGNVFVSGYSYYLSSSNSDYVTIKYSSAGTQQWVVKFDGPAHNGDGAYAIALDAAGSVYVTGGSVSGSAGSDIATVKYNSSGVQIWSSLYDGPGQNDDGAYTIAIDPSGNVVVGGFSTGNSTGYDYCVIKYSSTGSQLWVSRYDGPLSSTDYIFGLAVAPSGNIYVTGMSTGNGTAQDYCTIKYNASGIQQWISRYSGTGIGSDWAYGIVLDQNENSYVAGYADSSSTGHDCCTVKYNSSGVQQWVQKYSTGGDDRLAAIGIDANSNVYVEGHAIVGAAQDFITIKYSQPSGIQQISSQIPQEFSISQNYPNPFNPSTNIKFQIARLSNVKLVIFDILGREIETLINERMNPGTYEMNFDASKLPSGIYFYKFFAEITVKTKKMILIK